jgi:hypothetical protein
LNIDVFPVRSHFRLKASSLGEGDTGTLGAGPDVLCKPRPMRLKLRKYMGKNQAMSCGVPLTLKDWKRCSLVGYRLLS